MLGLRHSFPQVRDLGIEILLFTHQASSLLLQPDLQLRPRHETIVLTRRFSLSNVAP
jgi:hypothetical protein